MSVRGSPPPAWLTTGRRVQNVYRPLSVPLCLRLQISTSSFGNANVKGTTPQLSNKSDPLQSIPTPSIPSEATGSNGLFVSQLGPKIDKQRLRREFESFGEISVASVNSKSGRGFVKFVNAVDATAALKAKHGAVIDGLEASVQLRSISIAREQVDSAAGMSNHGQDSSLTKEISDQPRIPRAVQAVYLKPLRREALYGHPSCNLQMRSYSVRNLEFFADFALRAAYYLKLPAYGPVPLPQITERWTVPRSNFVFKKSQENFERKTLRRLIQIKDGHPDTVELWLAFLKKHAYHGVGMKADIWDHNALGKGKSTRIRDESSRDSSSPETAGTAKISLRTDITKPTSIRKSEQIQRHDSREPAIETKLSTSLRPSMSA